MFIGNFLILSRLLGNSCGVGRKVTFSARQVVENIMVAFNFINKTAGIPKTDYFIGARLGDRRFS